jgi:hypothetical protein
MKLRAYCGGKPKHQLLEALAEAAVGVRNEVGGME